MEFLIIFCVFLIIAAYAPFLLVFIIPIMLAFICFMFILWAVVKAVSGTVRAFKEMPGRKKGQIIHFEGKKYYMP